MFEGCFFKLLMMVKESGDWFQIFSQYHWYWRREMFKNYSIIESWIFWISFWIAIFFPRSLVDTSQWPSPGPSFNISLRLQVFQATFSSPCCFLQIGAVISHFTQALWRSEYPSKLIKGYTLPETNMAPENRNCQKEFIIFQPWIFTGYVSFIEGTLLYRVLCVFF